MSVAERAIKEAARREYAWTTETRDRAEYKCKCGRMMSHEVGEVSVLVRHGDEQRSFVGGTQGQYDALDWIAGLHREQRAEDARRAHLEITGREMEPEKKAAKAKARKA